MFYLSSFFLISSVIAFFVTEEVDFWQNILTILTSPSKLVTDYFALGGLASTLFNAGVCVAYCICHYFAYKVKVNGTTFAGNLLVVAHGFYGLNFLNMWPSIAGVLLYCLIMKVLCRKCTYFFIFYCIRSFYK